MVRTEMGDNWESVITQKMNITFFNNSELFLHKTINTKSMFTQSYRVCILRLNNSKNLDFSAQTCLIQAFTTRQTVLYRAHAQNGTRIVSYFILVWMIVCNRPQLQS